MDAFFGLRMFFSLFGSVSHQHLRVHLPPCYPPAATQNFRDCLTHKFLDSSLRGMVEFRTYAPDNFQYLRQLFGIQPEEYTSAWREQLQFNQGRQGSFWCVCAALKTCPTPPHSAHTRTHTHTQTHTHTHRKHSQAVRQWRIS